MGKITFEDRVSNVDFIQACEKAKSIEELSQYFQVSTTTITRRIDKLGCRKPNGRKVGNSYEYSDDEFMAVCEKSISMRQAASIMHIPFTSFKRRAEKLDCYNTNQAGVGIDKEYKSKYFVNDRYFDIWTPQMAYWYGFIVADGGIVPNCKHRLKLRLSSKYEYMLKRFKQDISFTGPILRGTTKAITNSDKKYEYSEIIVNNKCFVKSLKEKGIVERKTYIDLAYINFVPMEYRPYFLIGLFDGDGHIEKRDGDISFAGNRVNLFSVSQFLGLSNENVRVDDKSKYIVLHLRYKKDSFKFYQIYLRYCKDIHTLEYKRERIEYFYKVQSQRHPEWL